MSISADKLDEPLAVAVDARGDRLVVDLADGRTISVPISWYPRLAHASEAERRRWQLVGAGRGIHWPALDEDISVEALLSGQRSSESQRTLSRWLEKKVPGTFRFGGALRRQT